MTMHFDEASVPDQSGRTALVTGANSGLGFEIARVLAGRGARVLLACRSAQRAEQALQRIRALHPGADLHHLPLDLGDLASVRAAAEQAGREARLDLLINNAGVMAPPRRETADGFESQFGINHLGHFALTGLLLEKLRDTKGSRVVNVSSKAHNRSEGIDFDDPHARKSYSRMGRYGISKLANVLFTLELVRRLSGADPVVVAAHPGLCFTALSRDVPRWVFLLLPVMVFLAHPPQKGALPILRAAVDPEVRAGDYFGPGGRLETSGPPVHAEIAPLARDEAQARRLFELSIELTGVSPAV